MLWVLYYTSYQCKGIGSLPFCRHYLAIPATKGWKCNANHACNCHFFQPKGHYEWPPKNSLQEQRGRSLWPQAWRCLGKDLNSQINLKSGKAVIVSMETLAFPVGKSFISFIAGCVCHPPGIVWIEAGMGVLSLSLSPPAPVDSTIGCPCSNWER